MYSSYICILLFAASSVVIANPVSGDLVEKRQSPAEEVSDIMTSYLDLDAGSGGDDPTFSQTDSSYTPTVVNLPDEKRPIILSGNECGTTNDDVNSANQKRSIFRRQYSGRVCPSGLIPLKTDPNVKTPPSTAPQRGSRISNKKQTARPNQYPCAGKSRSAAVPTQSVHVSCGGPVAGDFPTDPDVVLNCVPGKPFFAYRRSGLIITLEAADRIPARTVFHEEIVGPAQYCCHRHEDEVSWLISKSI